jgi:hypothetical protein
VRVVAKALMPCLRRLKADPGRPAPTAIGDIRAGAVAAGERAVASRSGLPGKIAGLERPKTWVQALIALQADFPLPVLLQVSGLARSTFFYHQTRLQAPDPQGTVKSSVTDIFTKNHGRYGHWRVHRELLNQGWTLAKKTVLKLMRALGLVCKVRWRKRYYSSKANRALACRIC